MELMPPEPDAPDIPADLDTLGVTEDQHHHDGRRARVRRPQTRGDDRAREPDPAPTRSSCSCRSTRSARRSAGSGSSGATVPATQRESPLVDEPRLSPARPIGLEPTQTGGPCVHGAREGVGDPQVGAVERIASENEFIGSARGADRSRRSADRSSSPRSLRRRRPRRTVPSKAIPYGPAPLGSATVAVTVADTDRSSTPCSVP